MSLRAADDFDFIRFRLSEIRKEERRETADEAIARLSREYPGLHFVQTESGILEASPADDAGVTY